MSTAVLAPLGFFLTYQANKDSGVYNIDSYKNIVRWLLGLREKRFNVMKEVIISEPNYCEITKKLATISSACLEYKNEHLIRIWPNYINLFASKETHDRTLLKIEAQLNQAIEELTNSRCIEILKEINSYPVVSARGHIAPSPHRSINIAIAIIFPIGILFYLRALFFRHRLREDVEEIIKINKEIQQIIYERKL